MAGTRGTVSSFDDPRGLGCEDLIRVAAVLTAEDGTSYPFHCTAIADGTRTIEAGTAVTFEVVPGHLGRWEAAAIAPVS